MTTTTPKCRPCNDTGHKYQAFYTSSGFCTRCEFGRGLAAWAAVPLEDLLAWQEAMRVQLLAKRKAERVARRIARKAAEA